MILDRWGPGVRSRVSQADLRCSTRQTEKSASPCPAQPTGIGNSGGNTCVRRGAHHPTDPVAAAGTRWGRGASGSRRQQGCHRAAAHTSARALKHKGSSQGLEPRVPSATSAPQVLLQGPQTAPSSPGADQAGTSAHNVQVLERVGSRHISDGGMWGRAHHPPRPGRRGGSRDPESQARLWCSGGGCIDEEVASRAACA